MGIPTSNDRYISLNVLLEAVGTAKTRYLHCPVNGSIVYIGCVTDVAVDGDNIVTGAINGTAITGGAFTVLASGSAAGVKNQAVPTAANAVKRGDAISMATDGGGSAGQLMVTVLIEQE